MAEDNALTSDAPCKRCRRTLGEHETEEDGSPICADGEPYEPPDELGRAYEPNRLQARTERREFKDFVYNPVVTWLRKVLGIADDQARAKAIASLMNSNFSVTTQLIQGLRQDLGAAISDGLNPTSEIALELAMRLEWYETHVESIRYSADQLRKHRRKEAMRAEIEHPTTPLPETPAPAGPERRGFDANGVAVPPTEEVPRGEDAPR